MSQYSYITSFSDYEKENAFIDEYGVMYSSDKKKLLRGIAIESYRIQQGTVVICDRAFQSLSIKNIFLPNTIKAIGICAFANNESLESINIPVSTEYIAFNNLFGGCINLKQLTIESPHFKLVNNLILSADLVNLFGALHISNDTLDIPPSVEHIAPNAFWGMKCVKHLIFSNDLKTLGYSAFKRSEFTSVHFNSVIDKVINVPLKSGRVL